MPLFESITSIQLRVEIMRMGVVLVHWLAHYVSYRVVRMYRVNTAHAFTLNRYSIVFAIVLLAVSKSLSS